MTTMNINVFISQHHKLKWDLPNFYSNMGRNVVTLIVILCLCNVSNATSVRYVTQSYSDTLNNGDINHLVVHSDSGKIYVGAVNSIYQFTENLNLEKTVNTGPIDDTPNCRPMQECEYTPIRTESVNKAILIDYDNARLITCSNLRQGHCEKRWLSNISQHFITTLNK